MNDANKEYKEDNRENDNNTNSNDDNNDDDNININNSINQSFTSSLKGGFASFLRGNNNNNNDDNGGGGGKSSIFKNEESQQQNQQYWQQRQRQRHHHHRHRRSRRVDIDLHQSAGGKDGILALAWRGTKVAWADHAGIGIVDLSGGNNWKGGNNGLVGLGGAGRGGNNNNNNNNNNNSNNNNNNNITRIARIDRPAGARTSLYPTISKLKPSLVFETSEDLLVAWGDCVMSVSLFGKKKVVVVGDDCNNDNGNNNINSDDDDIIKSNHGSNNIISGGNNNGRLGMETGGAEVTMAWQTDCIACGVIPIDRDRIAVLGLVPLSNDEVCDNDNTDSHGGLTPTGYTRGGRNIVDLQIIERIDGSLASSDALPLLNGIARMGCVGGDRGGNNKDTVTTGIDDATEYYILSSHVIPRMDDQIEILAEGNIREKEGEIFWGKERGGGNNGEGCWDDDIAAVGEYALFGETSFGSFNQGGVGDMSTDIASPLDPYLRWSMDEALHQFDYSDSVDIDNPDYKITPDSDCSGNGDKYSNNSNNDKTNHNESNNSYDIHNDNNDDNGGEACSSSLCSLGDYNDDDSDDYCFPFRPQFVKCCRGPVKEIRYNNFNIDDSPPVLVLTSAYDSIVACPTDVDDAIQNAAKMGKFGKALKTALFGIVKVQRRGQLALAVGRRRTMVKRHSFSELVDNYLIAVLCPVEDIDNDNNMETAADTNTVVDIATTEGDEEINANFNINASAIVDTNTNGDISADLHEDRDLDKDLSADMYVDTISDGIRPRLLTVRRLRVAAASTAILLGADAARWEMWTSAFAKIPGGLFALRPYIPVRGEIES